MISVKSLSVILNTIVPFRHTVHSHGVTHFEGSGFWLERDNIYLEHTKT